jgi:coproporphyrinogen III oxidase-like Fe-S oxidoreductase
LGTAWADDPGLLADLPDNERAAANWVAVRDRVLAAGFAQTSLTNFERAGHYRYEDASFRPDGYEVVGFGPGAASYAATPDFSAGLKVLNPDTAAKYTAAVRTGSRVWDRAFGYGPLDQRVFWLVRSLARLAIDRGRYRELFGSDPVDDFSEEFAALDAAGLVGVGLDVVAPTPVGQFYSDSIASVLAGRAVRANRAGPRAPLPTELLHDVRAMENSFGHM